MPLLGTLLHGGLSLYSKPVSGTMKNVKPHTLVACAGISIVILCYRRTDAPLDLPSDLLILQSSSHPGSPPGGGGGGGGDVSQLRLSHTLHDGDRSPLPAGRH